MTNDVMTKRDKSIFDNITAACILAFLIRGAENEALENVDRDRVHMRH